MTERTWNRVHFSSASGEWETPQDVFEWANERWGPFMLDVAATAENSLCPAFYDEGMDGRVQPWDRPWWCNPPYGRGLGVWLVRAACAPAHGVMLLPARTDTAWFHEHVVGREVLFLRGRLKFGGTTQSAPFPSMLVVFAGTKIDVRSRGADG